MAIAFAVRGKTTSTLSVGQRIIVAGSLGYAFVFLAALVLHPGNKHAYEAFFNSYQILPPVFASVCCLTYGRRGVHTTPARRVGWICIGLAGLCSAVGQSLWTYFESVRGIEVPSPGPPDVGYVGAYLFLIAGISFLFGSMPAVGRTRQLLDSAIATSSLGVLSWYFVVQHLWEKSDISLLAKVVSVAYPLGDIASLFGALVLINSTGIGPSLRRSLVLLASGLMLFTFFDTTYTYLSLHDSYHTGSWFDWAWSFGFLLIGFASLSLLWSASAAAEAEPPVQAARTLLSVMAPYAAAVSAFSIVAVHDYAQDHRLSESTFISGMGLMLLVLLRQVLTLLENRHLTTHLEAIVSQRTEQLTALHRLTVAVNQTLEVNQVVSAVVQHTLTALRADALVVQLLDSAPDAGDHMRRQHGLDLHPKLLQLIESLPACTELQSVPLPVGIHPRGRGGQIALRAPLMFQSVPIGMVCALRWSGEFESTDAELLESIAFEAGTAVGNARAYTAAVEAADRDPVTGLYNHRAVQQRLDREFRRARGREMPLSIIMMDLNNFKLFNDTYGHPIGDLILRRVGEALALQSGPQDILARYGGDEFVAILPGADGASALEFAQRLKAGMLKEGFRRAGDERTVPITLSFGIAVFPRDGDNRHELLTLADANLYAAKQSEAGIKTTTETQRAHRDLRSEGSFGVLDAMVTAVDNKDSYTRQHSEDVTEYSLWLAQEIGLSEETLRLIRIGGLLHDVGKIGVPNEILRKPGRLTTEEYEVMKRHPHLGAFIVGAIPGMEGIVDAVRFHHERWDGHGYPDGLAGQEIPLLGRIVAIADAFSAMTTARPYRKGRDWAEALDEIRANVGTQFDPALAKIFCKVAWANRPVMEDPLRAAA